MFDGFYDISKRGRIGQNIWNELEDTELVYHDPNIPIQTLQYRWEFTALLDIIKHHEFKFGFGKPDSLLEIGTWKGGSLASLISILPHHAKVLSISDPEHTDLSPILFKIAQEHSIDLEVYLNDSHHISSLAKANAYFEGGIDILFIDGDHTYEGAKQDFLDYGQLIAINGMIILQDIIWTARHPEVMVSKLWEEICCAGYKTQELFTSKYQSGLGIGIVYP